MQNLELQSLLSKVSYHDGRTPCLTRLVDTEGRARDLPDEQREHTK